MYFGGSARDVITAFTEDESGNVWFSGITESPTGEEAGCNSPSSAFPLCDPAGANYWQPNNAGGTDAFLARIDAGFHLTYSTFFGSPANDRTYDMAYLPSSIPVLRRIALVGRSLGTIPAPVLAGAFQQPGNAQKSGFIATFDTQGEQKWSTNVQGLSSLQAVAIQKGNLTVAGYTLRNYTDVNGINEGNESGPPAVTNGCTPVANTVCICDPGQGAYIDDACLNGDIYFAEFQPVQGTLKYSTFIGEGNEENPNVAFEQIATWHNDPFVSWRMLDIKVDDLNNVYLLGTTSNEWPGETYPVLQAAPFYHRPFPATTGDHQSDVTLHCIRDNRTLWWSTTFGAWFEHVPNSTYDYYNCVFGSDLGCDLALAPGKALYWAGTTGNNAFPAQCPYPGTSYCEEYSLSNAGVFQGFATRMSLVDINIGMDEPASTAGSGIVCSPNPSNGIVRFTNQGRPIEASMVRLFDPSGRLVADKTVRNGSCDLSEMALGAYEAVLISSTQRIMGNVPIILAR